MCNQEIKMSLNDRADLGRMVSVNNQPYSRHMYLFQYLNIDYRNSASVCSHVGALVLLTLYVSQKKFVQLQFHGIFIYDGYLNYHTNLYYHIQI